MKRKTCFIYCRQSSGQDEAGQSLSIQQQLANCRGFAAARGLEIAGEFTDANISGKTYPAGTVFEAIAEHDPGFLDWYAAQSAQKKFRPGLGALMARIGEAEYLVLDEITRLHRATAKSFLEQTLNYHIVKAGVKILQVKGSAIDLSQFDQQLIQMLRTQINDEQIRNQKLKSMESRRKLKDAGIYIGTHLWGCFYGRERQNRFDPEKAAVIRELHRLILSGETFYGICRIMNSEHLRHFRPAKRFYPATLRHIIANPVYAGFMYNSKKELIPCRNVENPPLTFEDFRRVQEILKRNAEKYAKTPPAPENLRFHPFRGILFCGVCGARLTLDYDRGRIFYYCRSGVLAHAEGCSKVRIYIGERKDRAAARSPGLFTALGILLEGLRQTRRTSALSAAGPEECEKLESELHRLRGKIRTAYSQFCEDLLDEETYREITADVMLRCRALEDQLACMTKHPQKAENAPPGKRLLQGLPPCPSDLTERQKSEFLTCLRSWIRKIIVFQDRVRIVLADVFFDLPRDDRSSKSRFMPRGVLRRAGVRHWELCYIYSGKTRKREKIAEAGELSIYIKGNMRNMG